MKALPAARYEFAVWKRAKVSLDYHIELRSERHYYSVPFRLVGEVVAATVEVFYHHNRVASHMRRYRPGYTTEPAHMPEPHRLHAGWTPARIVAWAGKAGPGTAKFAEAVLASRLHPETGLPHLSRHSPPGRALQHRTPGGCLHPGVGTAFLHLPLGRVHIAPRPGQVALAGQ